MQEAVDKYGEGITYYFSVGSPTHYEGIKTKITQIYTNRALAFHMLNQQENVLECANYVLENLDPCNFKALMRRAISNRSFLKFDLAKKDLRKLRELMHPNDTARKEVKKLLNSCERAIT